MQLHHRDCATNVAGRVGQLACKKEAAQRFERCAALLLSMCRSVCCLFAVQGEFPSLFGRICNPTVRNIGICNPETHDCRHYKCLYSQLADCKSVRTSDGTTLRTMHHSVRVDALHVTLQNSKSFVTSSNLKILKYTKCLFMDSLVDCHFAKC